jgi:hypothetical protein
MEEIPVEFIINSAGIVLKKNKTRKNEIFTENENEKK